MAIDLRSKGMERMSGFLDIEGVNANYEQKYGFRDQVLALNQTKKGLSRSVVEEISRIKNEPKWMLDFRLRSLDIFLKKPMPKWGGDLSNIDFNNIIYYLKPSEKTEKKWEDVPENIKKTFDRLGIPEAEKKFLAGVGAQYESETVYHKLREDLAKQGVIFLDTGQALKEHEDLFRRFFSTVIPPEDNKFAALNSAVWSGGSFIYVPPGVHVDLPLQAYFRINAQNMGQFERTLIIADKNSSVHYIEGCFTKGAPVVTMEGIKPVEEVSIGDSVLTHTIQYKRVYHTQVRPYTGKLYTIEYFGDTAQRIEVTEEHPFLTVVRHTKEYKNTDWETQWVNAGSLRKGDYIAIPIDRTTDSAEERAFTVKIGSGKSLKDITLMLKTDADFFRLIGYYLSEGSIVGGHYLHFTFNEKERPYIDDVKELLERYFGKKPHENKPYKNGISVVLSSTATVRFFESQFGKGASGKSVPSWVLKEAPEKQKELIKGFWRGDGSFMMQQYSWGIKRMFRMNTISKNLAVNIRNILLRLNIFGSINLQKRTGKRKDMYCVYVGGSFLKAFAETIEAFPSNEVIVGRQIAFQQLRQINAKSYAHITENYALVPIKSISARDVENVSVYNFSVEDDESYIANGVVVHNCTAPVYASDSLHSAVVELIAMEGARLRYTTIQNWSANVYNLVTKRAYAYKDAIVEWIDGNIGCLTGDAKILTNNDVREIKDIEEGEYVYSLNSDFTISRQEVIAKKVNPNMPVFKLKTENQREVVATSNHPFLVLSKTGKLSVIKWKRLDEIKEGDLVAISGSMPDNGKSYKIEFKPRKRTKKKITFPRETTEELMWLLGFYIGDGYKDKGRVYFAVPETDKSNKRVKELVKKFFGLDYEQKGVAIRINSAELVDLISQLGFSGKAVEKRVPKWVFALPMQEKLAFIQGYIDADGYVRKNHKNLCISSANKALLEDVKILAISCGLNPTKISKWTRRDKLPLGKEVKEYTNYFLYFGEKNLDHSIYFVRVSEIVPNGEAVTYDIEVDGPHNFIANGILVHNSKLTMKYPSVFLLEPGARADILSVAYAGKGQHQDAGGKAVHLAPNTSSTILSKSISKDGGRTTYRGLLKVAPGATNVKSNVRCDALILDERSASDTVPYMEIEEKNVSVGHEATVGKISDEQLFYLMSRGLTEQEAMTMIVSGFIEPFTKELPLEYAVELNRLIQLEMTGAVG